MKFRKRGIVSEYLPWILISVAVLVIFMIAIFVMRGEGLVIVDKLKLLFKGR
jgi:hypothetical protein